jgi:O-antigen/teichoic acid export membrane protein
LSARLQPLNSLKTDHLLVDLKGRSLRGGLVALSSQGAQFLIQSVSTVVLARLLTPADFGMVAMVTVITGLAQAFADLGLSEATIQQNEITHIQVSNLFWINLAIGLGLTLITAALAPAFAWFYREPRLANIALLLSLIFLIGGLRVQPDALLKRQMRFSALAIRDVTSYAVAVPVAIIMALRGAGYWALVAIPLMLNFIQMALSWLMVNWRPSLPRRDAEVGPMVTFGSRVAASYFVTAVNRSADNALIGWYWGAAPLGLYSRAYNLLMLPVRQLSLPSGNVAITGFSRIRNDPERFARFYLRTANLIMWISAPIFGFLFVAAKPVILLTLGTQWLEAAPVFQILALSAGVQLLFDSTTWLLVSRGQSRRLLRLLLIISPIIVASFAIGLPFGIKGVALSGSLVVLIILPWTLKYGFRGTQLNLRRIGRAVLIPVSVCLVGVFCAELALLLILPTGILPELLVVALGFAVAYSLSALIPSVKDEIMSFRRLLRELQLSGHTLSPAAQGE